MPAHGLRRRRSLGGPTPTCHDPHVQLWIIRHAIAAELGADGDDAARALTRRGRRRFRAGAAGLGAVGVGVTRVLHSPWRRAAETAHLLRPLLRGPREGALVASELLCASPGAALLSQLAVHGAAGGLAVVGHEPWLGELAAWLAFGDARHAAAIPLKKGGVVALDGTPTPGGMSVRALLPPRLLRQLGRRRR